MITWLVLKLQEDLKSVIDWMDSNNMKLNLEKTQLIVLSNAYNVAKIGQISLEMNGVVIESSDTLKSLGLTIDSQMKWNAHINQLSRSYHLKAKSIYPLRKIVSHENFLIIFNACVNSLLNYMSIVWGSSCKKTLKPLEKCIRYNARVLLNRKKYDPIRHELYHTLKWYLPTDQYKYTVLCFIYQTLILDNIPYFNGVLKYRHEIHSHKTRNINELHLNYIPRNSYGCRSVFLKGCNFWNDLPVSITSSKTLPCFKSNLKKHIILNL